MTISGSPTCLLLYPRERIRIHRTITFDDKRLKAGDYMFSVGYGYDLIAVDGKTDYPNMDGLPSGMFKIRLKDSAKD